MIGLFDRDVFLKLGCCALWDMAVDALQVTEPYRLAATSSDRSNRKAVGKMLGALDIEPSIARITAMVQSVPVLGDDMIADIEASDGFQRLGGIDGIDGGERVLAAILIQDPAAQLLISGDKRFVGAMQNAAPADWATIQGSVISFESCLLAVEAMHGFEVILDHAHPVCCCDGSLRMALGGTPDAATFRHAMASYNPCPLPQAAAAQVFGT